MDAIRQYIESLFMNLPNTEDVFRAKQHLLEMAEDKYLSLKEDGVSDNEAVAKVIAEFGNLDELKAELGIEDAVKWQADNRQGVNMISLDNAKDIIRDFQTRALVRGLGIMCFICCVVPCIISNAPFFMFILIGLGVVLMVIQRNLTDRWDYLKTTPCGIDVSTAEYVKEEMRRNKLRLVTLRTVGVLLIVGCWVPATVIYGRWGGALLFICIGVGVWLISYVDCIQKTYEKLLALNPMNTVGATYSKGSGRVVYTNPNLAAVMCIYWPLVACLYVSISFLTFAWWITWVVFPVAAVIQKYIEEAFGERE